MSTLDDGSGRDPVDDMSFAELARRQGIVSVASPAELAQPDLWESDEEYTDFLTDLYAARRSGAV